VNQSAFTLILSQNFDVQLLRYIVLTSQCGLILYTATVCLRAETFLFGSFDHIWMSVLPRVLYSRAADERIEH
jgi:hypothetical protein